jgi:DNA mismatch repair protein MutS
LSVAFHSILFDDLHDGAGVDKGREPGFFRDLNLDQVVESVTAGREEYDLQLFFWRPLRSVGAITYRHEVFRDLEGTLLFGWVREFAVRMRSMREHLVQADKLRYRYQRSGGSSTPR